MKIYIILLTSLFALNCQKKKEENTTEPNTIEETNVTLTPKQLEHAALTIGTVEERTVASVLKVNGIIDVPPQNLISISMPLGGYLKSTKLLPGMHLNKGEVIATMEDQQYIQLQQDYLITQSRLSFAEKEYERQKELNQSQASSDKVYQMANADYKSLRITLNALGEKLKLINVNPNTLTEKNISKSVNIYAPINCFVSKVNVNIGKYVNPSDVLFELINPEDIHLNLKVFEKDITKLAIGQKLIAYTNNQPEDKHKCEIILISKDLSVDAHAAEVHCHFDDYDRMLLPGMYMNAEIEVKSKNAATVPEDAIVTYEGKQYVFVAIDKSNFKMTVVSTGVSENGYVEITNATDLANKRIVTKGSYTLLMVLKNKSEE
jgi:cobalt-zinc-cadmium efflux system membrane fusion protein